MDFPGPGAESLFSRVSGTTANFGDAAHTVVFRNGRRHELRHAEQRAAADSRPPCGRPLAAEFESVARFTKLQGQYLAFIQAYTKIHGVAPAEADMQRYFRVTPPSVHQMILTLEKNGLISRIPGKGRSIALLMRREDVL